MNCTLEGGSETCHQCSIGYQWDSPLCVLIDCEQDGVYDAGDGKCEFCSKGCKTCTDQETCSECMAANLDIVDGYCVADC